MRIRIRLWHRLFIAFAGLSIVALATFAVLQQQSLRRGFLGYLNQLSLERVSDGAVHLGQRYDASGDWDFVRDRPGELLLTLGLAPGRDGPNGPLDRRPANPAADEQRPEPRRPGALPPPRARSDGPPPPPPSPNDRLGGEAPPFGVDQPRPFDPGRLPPPPPPLRAGPLDLAARLLLVDNDDKPIAGNPDVPIDSPAIVIQSHGLPVGRLLLAPMPKLRGDLDLSFAQAQLRQALWMALAVLLGALLLSWLLARWLLSPILALGAGARALVAGDFATRVPATRSDELGALADDFNQLAATLEQNRDARRQWGADIAHELRTPISILRGEIQALQDGIRTPGPETLGSLHAECDRLAGLVDDLYELALSDAGALAYRFEPLQLDAVLRDVVLAHGGAIKDAGLELSLDAMPTHHLPVCGDAQRLAQLFGNLLRNCLRYTHAPGKVRIGVLRDGVRWLVQVDDTPPGVPEASLQHLFDRMYRVEPSRSRAFGGAGLGLAICRNIVRAHGGEIAASTSPMGGLRISVYLPIPDPLP